MNQRQVECLAERKIKGRFSHVTPTAFKNPNKEENNKAVGTMIKLSAGTRPEILLIWVQIRPVASCWFALQSRQVHRHQLVLSVSAANWSVRSVTTAQKKQKCPFIKHVMLFYVPPNLRGSEQKYHPCSLWNISNKALWGSTNSSEVVLEKILDHICPGFHC